jgi:hypothetical protein
VDPIRITARDRTSRPCRLFLNSLLGHGGRGRGLRHALGLDGMQGLLSGGRPELRDYICWAHPQSTWT